MSVLKQQLYILCGEYIRQREASIRKAIVEAQEAANEETQNGGGDAYETGRESMQQEIELNLTRLSELDKQKQMLDTIITDHTHPVVQPGSVVRTNNGNYFIAIGAGQLKVDDHCYYAISVTSPIGSKLAGQQAGTEFALNGKTFVIESVA